MNIAQVFKSAGMLVNLAAGTPGGALYGAAMMYFDGANYQRCEGVVASPADGQSNTYKTVIVGTYGMVYNGTTWDRARSVNSVSGTPGTGLSGVGILLWDGTNYQKWSNATGAAGTGGAIIAATHGMLFDGAVYQRSLNTTGAVATNGAQIPPAGLMAFDSSVFQTLRTIAAANIAATTQPFALMTGSPGEWSTFNTPAAAAQATATKAAGGAGVRHVCKQITFSVEAVAAQAGIQINLRDGASGAGTVLWSITIALPLGGHSELCIPCNIIGSPNTAMTIESSAAPAATNFASVSMSGFSTV